MSAKGIKNTYTHALETHWQPLVKTHCIFLKKCVSLSIFQTATHTQVKTEVSSPVSSLYLCLVTRCTSHRCKRSLFAASRTWDVVHLQQNNQSVLNSELIKQTQQTTTVHTRVFIAQLSKYGSKWCSKMYAALRLISPSLLYWMASNSETPPCLTNSSTSWREKKRPLVKNHDKYSF